MTWTTPADLRAQLQRLWGRGELLGAARADGLAWPLRLRLKGPSSSEFTDRFAEVRAWAETLAAMPRMRLAWREVRHRVHGLQRLPSEAWIDRAEDAIALAGKGPDAEAWARLREATADAQPELVPWVDRYPLRALTHADAWPRLLAVVDWVHRHPRPGVYLRQVDAPGFDSKFIEAHRPVLAELLDSVLPDRAVDRGATGVGGFARRYGFREKPLHVRLRTLDPSIRVIEGASGEVDVALDADTFAALDLPVRQVFITENETNFLAFPPVEASIVVFGAGYGWDAVGRARWLRRCRARYWGDIDTHGFAILDALRAHLPEVASLLMDRVTLLAHEVHWTEEPSPVQHDLARLTADEQAVFDDLRDGRYRDRLRLEQERVGFGWVQARLAES